MDKLLGLMEKLSGKLFIILPIVAGLSIALIGVLIGTMDRLKALGYTYLVWVGVVLFLLFAVIPTMLLLPPRLVSRARKDAKEILQQGFIRDEKAFNHTVEQLSKAASVGHFPTGPDIDARDLLHKLVLLKAESKTTFKVADNDGRPPIVCEEVVGSFAVVETHWLKPNICYVLFFTAHRVIAMKFSAAEDALVAAMEPGMVAAKDMSGVTMVDEKLTIDYQTVLAADKRNFQIDYCDISEVHIKTSGLRAGKITVFRHGGQRGKQFHIILNQKLDDCVNVVSCVMPGRVQQ